MKRSGATAAASIERFLQVSLLALVATGAVFAAVCGWWDAPTLALTAIALAWRGTRLAGAGLTPPPFAVAALALAWCGFSLIEAWGPARFPGDAVPLLYFLAAAALLIEKTNLAGRGPAPHGFRVALLCFAALLALALHPPAPASSWHWRVSCLARWPRSPPPRSFARSKALLPQVPRGRLAPRLVVLACSATICILLLAAGLFFLLPRTIDASPAMAGYPPPHLEGFSSRVTLREIGELKSSSRPIMHITIFSPRPVAGLKWRGDVLTNFDGREWTNPELAPPLLPAPTDHFALVPSPSASPARTSPMMWNSNQPIPPPYSSPARRRAWICAIKLCSGVRAVCPAWRAVRRELPLFGLQPPGRTAGAIARISRSGARSR
jgi:hypothetical protein